VRTAIAARMEECRLELHPEKTKVVYCKDDDRRRRYPNEKSDFLGYGFQPRRSKNRYGKYFINFSPAISGKAGKPVRDEIRSWDLHLRSDKAIEDPGLAAILRAVLSPGHVPLHASTGSLAGPLGVSEIPEAARSFAQGNALDCAHFAAGFEAVCALADGRAARLHGGSRMS